MGKAIRPVEPHPADRIGVARQATLQVYGKTNKENRGNKDNGVKHSQDRAPAPGERPGNRGQARAAAPATRS